MMPTAVLMVDNSNIHVTTKNLYGQSARFSHRSLEELYDGNYRFVEKHIAGSFPPVYHGFWRKMEDNGYYVHTYERKFNFKTGHHGEKSIDTAIVANGIEAIIALKPDVFVLLGGDLDMLPLVEKAKERNVAVHVWAYRNSISREMREAADEFYAIDDCIENLIYFQSAYGMTENYSTYMDRIAMEEESTVIKQAQKARLNPSDDDVYRTLAERIESLERRGGVKLKTIDTRLKPSYKKSRKGSKIFLGAILTLFILAGVFLVGHKIGKGTWLPSFKKN